MIRQRTAFLVPLLLAAIAGVATTSLAADPVADFYRGRTLTIVVSSSPGGGYDAMARAAAHVLPTHLAGAPTVIVQNMPGAGGIVATNYLWARAARDGSVIGQVQANTAFEPLQGTREAVYEPARFNWLGSPASETGVFTVWHTTGVKTIEEARRREFVVAVPGMNSTPSLYARLIRDTLGIKLRLIAGYRGQNDSQLAMERGEADAYPNFYNTLMAFRPDWISTGKVAVLAQYGPDKEPALGPVPSALDLAANDNDRALMNAAFAALAVGRPFVAPPDIPAERVAALRAAMLASFRDPIFIGEVERAGLKVNHIRSGEDLSAVIAAAYAVPPHIVERLRRLQSQ